MNELPHIKRGYFSLNYSARQKMQSSQPASEPQVLPSHELLLMVSVFYIAPTILLIGIGLATHLKRKFKLGRDIQKLSHVASLERVLSLKPKENINS
ncbi:hypothetical protein C7293_16855 [filamentous cyanobacterium CCT1]|nr:hypothetical protein C7293_16855 [filamentous cyanobacterium CCT1]PSN79969.1 hypothetical protein C8B47_08940 [filamentous cyanobacterium CCP4]